MFGYIVPDKPEMKIKEFELFRAYYCGVCKSMGRSFGLLSRFALNYDSVFLGLFLAALNNQEPKLLKEACIANPVKKKWVVADNKYVDYAADINVLLTYYKLADNWHDEHNPLSYSAMLLSHGGYNKARKRNGQMDKVIKEAVGQLALLEKSKCNKMDIAAEPFANMMKSVLKLGYAGEDQGTSRTLEWIGYNLGKWIYLIDAYDDIEKDAVSGSYNPLIEQYGLQPERRDENPLLLFKNEIKEEVNFNLVQSLGQIASSAELLKLGHKPLIDNILYQGLYKKTETILSNVKHRRRE